MTRAERLRRCYFHEELDRPGVYFRTGFPKEDPSYDEMKAYLGEHTELKLGWSTRNVQTTEQPEDWRREPVSEDFERVTHILHTPKGDLQSSQRVSLKGQPGLHETYYVNSREDAEKYLSLPTPEIEGPVDEYFTAVKEIGDRGIVEASLSINPGGQAAVLCGSETFAMMSITDRDVLYALCERERDIIVSRLKYCLERGVGPYFNMAGQEYITPPLHGPKDFHDFNVQYDKQIIDLVHEAGGRVHVHCHGSIKAVFPGFLEMGADVLHPFEAPPMGDITPEEAKSLARGNICLEGNVQIADLYEKDPDEIREQVAALIDDAFDDRRGLIICPTASPYIRGAGEACFARCRALVETVLDFRP